MCICATTLEADLYVSPGSRFRPTCLGVGVRRVTRTIERGLDKTVGFGVEEGYSDACWEDGWCDLIPRCLVKLKEVLRMEESRSWLCWVWNCPDGWMHGLYMYVYVHICMRIQRYGGQTLEYMIYFCMVSLFEK